MFGGPVVSHLSLLLAKGGGSKTDLCDEKSGDSLGPVLHMERHPQRTVANLKGSFRRITVRASLIHGDCCPGLESFQGIVEVLGVSPSMRKLLFGQQAMPSIIEKVISRLATTQTVRRFRSENF